MSNLLGLPLDFYHFNPPEADKGLIPRPLGRLRWFPIDTPLLAAGKFIFYHFSI